MEINKNASNPMLIGAIELLKAEPTKEHQKLVVTQTMEAHLMTPAFLDPEPVADEDGNYRISNGCKMQFPMLKTTDGRVFMMGFTDRMEYDKWKSDRKAWCICLTTKELVMISMGKDERVSGLSLNPFGTNVVIPRDTLLIFSGVKTGADKNRTDK